MDTPSSAMLADQRQQYILHQLTAHGGVRVGELVTALEVSDMTIRRDIEALAAAGQLQRVHGGAIPLSPTAHEPEYAVKISRNRLEKSAIATAALQHVQPGSTIAISGGSTTAEFAGQLADSDRCQGLTIITNSLPAATLLRSRATVLLTGGQPTPSDALVGPIAELTCSQLHADVLFLGVHAMNAASGLSTPNVAEAATMRALISQAGRTVVLADSSKWDMSGLSVITGWDRISTLITDAGLPASAQDFFTSTTTTLELVQ